VTDRTARWLLAVRVLGQLVLMTRQAARQDPAASPLGRWTVRMVGPVAGFVVGFLGVFDRAGDTWRTRSDLRRDNERLRERLDAMERELLRREGIEEQVARLAEAVRYSRQTRRSLQVADVVYADHRSWLRSLLVRVGSGGTEIGQPVLAPAGLVGRVVVAANPYAKVQLLTDRSSAVGVMVERTRRQGVLRGQGDEPLTLEYLPLSADVRIGDRIVTAGIDGTYPRGLPVGVVVSVGTGPQLFQRIEVRPRVDFGLLDTVYLLPRQDLPAELAGEDLP
jgi:rod shape-determining protein MreC